MPPDLRPTVGTRLTGNGVVVQRDVTRLGLHRMTVEAHDRYPDLNAWVGMLDKGARLTLHYYTERISAGVFVGSLWMFWKEG